MLKVFTLENSGEWDKIVSGFSNYDVYWLSGYVKGFQLHGDGLPLLFYYEDDRCKGVNLMMKRDIADDARFNGKIPRQLYYDFSSPYGYGGWLVEGNSCESLFEEYEAWCKKNGIISEFVRFHPMLHNHMMCEEFYNISQLGEVVHMELSSPELIWENIKSKNRNVIRKAIKNGVKIYNGRFPEIYNEFIDIYNGTMDKDNADEYYYFEKTFYESILNDLPYNSQIFYAVKDEKIIAASIIIMANKKMNYHLSGSLREYSSFAPTNYLLYEAALWGCHNGYETFYLGGGVGSGEDSLFKFKRAFYKGDLNSFYIGRKIYDEKKYEELVQMRKDITTNYFPEYRAK